VTAASTVALEAVTKRFGRAVAVDSVDLAIAEGEFFSLLGPSGCGKTTTLRMLGGFLVPDEGRIRLAGADVTDVPPYRRDVNTVFQSYALFSHLDVAGNIAFGLRRRRVARAEIRRRVGEMLELVDMAGRAGAKPAELSGGQQQRVALARALVNMPKLLLLDEPLGALDLKLRRQMQDELKRIHREVGVTFVYVTHDQEEALNMSDRIAVMDRGRIEQVGAPREIYEHPATAFVAGFIGTSNLLPGRLDGSRELVLDAGGRIAVDGAGNGHAPGARVVVSLRPEKIRVGGPLDGSALAVAAEVVEVSYLGASTHYALRLDDGARILATEAHAAEGEAVVRRPGDRLTVSWRWQDAVILPEPRPG
jgi:spermidine/putrescine transport system ATP-binding protein